MSSSVTPPMTRMRPGLRRRSITCAYANGALWGMGTGLASVTLVTYLAREYGATGIGVSWLLAAPALAGLLRLLTPWWLEKVASRQRFCIALFLASALVLFALPVISAPHVLPLEGESIAALAVTWISYHVLEYIGSVALWSWYGDLVPRRIRGRFVGRRQAMANAGKVCGIVLAALVTYVWTNRCQQLGQQDREWLAYAACSLAGAMLFALSAWPLCYMRDVPCRRTPGATAPDRLRRQLLGPWADPKYRRLLVYGIWFAFSNGLVQTAQWMLQLSVLKINFVEKKTLDAVSRGVQSLLMPQVGDWVDRRGNVRVLVVSQAIIALAPLFFLMATPDARWWILGAYVCWLAYAGEEVAQPNLMLGLSPPGESAAHASAWFAWTQLVYSLSVLLGGWLFDWMATELTPFPLGWLQVDHFVVLFLTSWCLKSLGVFWAARIRE